MQRIGRRADARVRTLRVGRRPTPRTGIAALSAAIAIHTSELPGKVDETAYLGFGYVLLIAASFVSIVLLAQRDPRGWLLGGLTAAATFAGFVLTRTTGLPNAHGDVGNRGETIGVWSLVAEGLVVVLAMFAVARDRRLLTGISRAAAPHARRMDM